MKRASTWAGVSAALCLCIVSPLSARAANRRKQLEEALKADYEVAHMGIGRLRITQPGTILVIQQDGIRANPSIDFGNVTDKVIDGHVQGPKGFAAAFFSNQRDRSLKVGTDVYVTRISVNRNAVQFDIVTTNTSTIDVNGNSRYMRYAATLDFEFPKNFVETADSKSVKKAIGAVLLPQSEVQAAKTRTVALGQTPAQVRAALGAPNTIIKLGAKQIFVYKDMKVIFINGKVSNVE
jgi:hypothetical protein